MQPEYSSPDWRSRRGLIFVGALALMVGLVWVFISTASLATCLPGLPAGQLCALQAPGANTPIRGVADGLVRSGQSPDEQVFPTLVRVWLPSLVHQLTPSATPTPTRTSTATPTPTPTRTPTTEAASCVITWPPSNATVTTTGNCVITISGAVRGATPGSYLDFSVYTNAWYRQDPTVRPPVPSGSWQARPIYLAGQGVYNRHSIRANLHDSSGAVVASCQVSGIVRSNGCSTP
ncbi:MAG: hypothetical protein NT169_22760 [Chloroflexi bacterium]|nr:hypothetical protein [Chloroflexota bacterium]